MDTRQRRTPLRRATPRAAGNEIRTRARRGFSLVEIIVALTIFAVIMSALGGLLFTVGVQGKASVAKAERMAAMTTRVNQITALPFDSLLSRTGCTHAGEPPHERTECVTVTNMSSKVTRVTVVITPDNSALKPDTARIDRGRPAAANPFKTP